MPTHCCVPECNQKGVKSPTGFFEFPNQSSLRKRWIHAIQGDGGKNWQITRDTKVCSLHFRREDLRKSLAGRTYLVDGCVPSRFAWSIPSPRKRKAPTERLPLPIPLSSKKRLFTSDTSSEINIASSAVESSNEIFPSTSGGNETNEPGNETDEPDISVESNVEMDQGKKVEDLEARLLQSEKELAILRKELERKIIENEQHQETLSSRLFSLDRFKSNADVNFYTGLPNYATLISIFEFLNPGEDCENIRSRISSDVPEEFYNSESDDEEDTSTTKRGRRRKLKPLEEFFIVLCRLRRGFSERHLANLYGSISDREIVVRSGLLSQAFDDGDSVMADKGFQIQDILPLGVTLNIPPFLGGDSQMSAEDVVRTQQIASLRIHVERAINKIKNFRIWQRVVPLSLFGVVNQMWSVCAFMCNVHDPLISG
ncbi:unnamed protein product [Porites lobata]|uniref:THAP-type domain-containing protein n=1 Tax=Porites lobata TaxID=104759 RepID=A0ABN8QYV4_9CNID|nr:unnamed protein product [Porites lobata]